MFSIQALIAFLVWIGYGVIQARRSGEVRAFAQRQPRSSRGLIAAGLLVLAVAVLFGGLEAIARLGAFGKEGLTAVGWLAVALIGLAFIHLQTLAIAILVTMAQEAVTKDRDAASTSLGSSQEDE